MTHKSPVRVLISFLSIASLSTIRPVLPRMVESSRSRQCRGLRSPRSCGCNGSQGDTKVKHLPTYQELFHNLAYSFLVLFSILLCLICFGKQRRQIAARGCCLVATVSDRHLGVRENFVQLHIQRPYHVQQMFREYGNMGWLRAGLGRRREVVDDGLHEFHESLGCEGILR